MGLIRSEIVRIPPWTEVGQMVADLALLHLPVGLRRQASYMHAINPQRSVELVARELTPTPSEYVRQVNLAYSHWTRNLPFNREDMGRWMERMRDYGIDLFGAGWPNYIAGQRSRGYQLRRTFF